MPRKDISADITAEVVEKLSSPVWKVRQEGLESIAGILEKAHMRVQPTGTGQSPNLLLHVPKILKKLRAEGEECRCRGSS